MRPHRFPDIVRRSLPLTIHLQCRTSDRLTVNYSSINTPRAFGVDDADHFFAFEMPTTELRCIEWQHEPVLVGR